jgi:hypothetical protein
MGYAIEYSVLGEFNKTKKFLENALALNNHIDSILRSAAEEGKRALEMMAPKDTGLMASSWGYTIDRGESETTITWHNYDIEGGYNVAILIQYGHGTGTGGYVVGRDFINPAIQPVFDNLVELIWEEVTR